MSEKELKSVPDGHLEPDEFKLKYGTNCSQRHPESFLEEVSDEDREIYEDVDILTGRDKKGRTNKFCNAGHNKGRTYNTVNKRLYNSWLRALDQNLEQGKIDDFFELILDVARGNNTTELDTQMVKLMLERMLGKVTDKIELKQEGEITFSIDPSKIIDVDNKEETSE